VKSHSSAVLMIERIAAGPSCGGLSNGLRAWTPPNHLVHDRSLIGVVGGSLAWVAEGDPFILIRPGSPRQPAAMED